MSKELAGILASLLIEHVDKNTEGMNTSSDVAERIERMFINGNFVSIEYWIESKLRKK